MAALSLETYASEKPILLLTGEKNPLTALIIRDYQDDFTIAYITNSGKPVGVQDATYRIRHDAAKLLKDLEEKIEYATIFLDSETKKIASYIFEKLIRDKTRTAILININDALIFKDIIIEHKNTGNFYFIFYGDIYSEDPEFNPESASVKFLEDALREKKVTLTGGDLHPLFPIYHKDALVGINHVIFGRGGKQKAYYLFYNHPQTYISAVKMIERAIPDLEINYSDETSAAPPKTRDEIEHEIRDFYGLPTAYLDRYFQGFEKSIQHFVDRGPIKRDLPGIVEKPAKVIGKQKPKIKRTSLSFLWAFVIFLILNAALGIASLLLFTTSISAFRANDYNTMKQSVRAADVFYDITNPAALAVVKTASMLGFRGLEDNYRLFSEGIALLTIASADFDTLEKLRTGISAEVLENKIADAFYLYFTGVKLKGETASQALNTILTKDLANVLAVSQVSREVLGYDRPKTYLLLFQNDGELRPTGGFIGSVGELRVKEGKIEDVTIEDVYEHDGKLKVHLEPHYVLRRNVQKNLYLRDSNFELDFQKSAAKAALIYNLEANKKVDGVIAINFEAVRRIIDEVGPIKLSSYNQTLDGKNAFDFLEKTIDDNFFPGSTQKRDVLNALFDQLMLKFEDRNSLIKVARLLPKLAEEKHLMFAFNDVAVQSVFSSLNYGGEYKDKRPAETNVMHDFLSINEANIGGNKANSKVTRKLAYKSDITGSTINSIATLTLKNGFDKEYKTYIRVVTPLGSKLTGIKINGGTQEIEAAITDFKIYEAGNFRAPTGLEVDQSPEVDHQVFGFVTTVPKGSEQVIEVSYENGIKKIDDESKVTYSLQLVKQPGLADFPFTFEITYGSGFSPSEVENAKLENGKVIISQEIAIDQEFKIELLKR